MKHSWWETDNAHGILIIIATILGSCLLLFRNDLWIGFSVLYIYLGTWIYHFTVKNKNIVIDSLTHRTTQLERYTKWLKKELEKTQSNSNL